jgi:hypothetical protein
MRDISVWWMPESLPTWLWVKPRRARSVFTLRAKTATASGACLAGIGVAGVVARLLPLPQAMRRGAEAQARPVEAFAEREPRLGVRGVVGEQDRAVAQERLEVLAEALDALRCRDLRLTPGAVLRGLRQLHVVCGLEGAFALACRRVEGEAVASRLGDEAGGLYLAEAGAQLASRR